MSVGAATAEEENFTHPALFYHSDQEYLDGLLPFIIDGLDKHEPVAAAVPGPRLELLRAALGERARDVTLLDMAEVGRNPGRIIAGVLRSFADARPDGHVRMVGEPLWPERSAAEYPACMQHEALINAAFTGRDVTIVCPYDAAGLQPHALADARATHPVVWQEGRELRSDHYAPEAVHARHNQPLADGTHAIVYSVATAQDLPALRRDVTNGAATQFGLDADKAMDLELIATELATNSVLHAGSACELQLWGEADHVVCDVRDAGHFADPLAGRRPPRPTQSSGRGLALVNDIADLVRLHTTPAGTTVRAHLRRHAN